MLKKIMNYLIIVFVFLLIIGISLQYYMAQSKGPERLVCHKGKLLVQVEDDETVYVRIKRFTCDSEKGMLILEEQL